MKLIEGYIFKNLFKAFLLTSLLFFFVSTLTRVFHYLDILTQNFGSIYDFLSILLLIQFKIFVVLSPFSLFIASIIVYSGMINSSEHIACYNIGISKIILLKPLIYLCFILFLINLFLSSIAVPFAYGKIDTIHKKLATQFTNSFLKPKELINQKGLLIFINEVSEDGVSKGILLIDARQPLQKSVIIADEGIIGFDGSRLSFNGGQTYINKKTDFSNLPLISHFTKYKIVINLQNSNNINISPRFVISNKELVLALTMGRLEGVLRQFKIRFGWPFLTILMPFSVAVCLVSFFGFARSQKKLSYIAMSILIVGYTVLSFVVGEEYFNSSLRDLFLYYVNIILIFVFLLLKLRLNIL